MNKYGSEMERPPVDRSWRSLYAIGGVLSLVYVVMIVVPLVLLVFVPLPPASGGDAILRYIPAHKIPYLAELICFVGLSIPALGVFLSLAVSLKESNKSLAALGGLIGIASEIIALALASSPQSLSGQLVYLSNQYSDALSSAQSLAITSAAEAFLATSNAVSWAGPLTAAGILILSVGMLRGVYHRGVAILGIVTGAVGMVFETLRPEVGSIYAVYGLLLPVWFVFVGLRLFRLGSKTGSQVVVGGDSELTGNQAR